MSTVYFISGLGADERMFHSLELKCKHIAHIRWIEPETDEPLKDYAKRLLPQVHHPHPILVGMSFGGVVAIELARLIQPKRTILISSMASSKSLPWYYHVMGWLRLHDIIPVSLMKRFHFVAPMLFGAATHHEKSTLKQVILETDPHFLRWAVGQLLIWHQPDHYENVTMIHGTSDHILPIREHPNIIKIKNAGHLMVLSHASEISAILDGLIGDCNEVPMDKNRYIARTATGEEIELTQATIIKSNNLYPFGRHNYAIYETPDGRFVKGMNNNEREIMLTSFELIDEKEARNYDHPYYRED